MKKSIFGFISGIAGSLSGIFVTFYTYLILAVILSFSTTLNSTIYSTLLSINTLSNIIAFIASFFYFKKANVGAILMSVAFVLNCLLYLFILFSTFENFSIGILIAFIPSILMLIAAICGF